MLKRRAALKCIRPRPQLQAEINQEGDQKHAIESGEYKNISFIHEIADSSVEDITADILSEAALPDIGTTSADLQASHFDHLRDLRKHEAV